MKDLTAMEHNFFSPQEAKADKENINRTTQAASNERNELNELKNLSSFFSTSLHVSLSKYVQFEIQLSHQAWNQTLCSTNIMWSTQPQSMNNFFSYSVCVYIYIY